MIHLNGYGSFVPGNSQTSLTACYCSCVYSLIKYTVEGVRLRLDRAYIEALGVHQMEKRSTPQNEREVMELQAELDSLYSEILPVAQMSAEQRYLDCAVRAIASQDKQGLEKSKTIIEYVRPGTIIIKYYANPILDFGVHHLSHRSRRGFQASRGGLPESHCNIKRCCETPQLRDKFH